MFLDRLPMKVGMSLCAIIVFSIAGMEPVGSLMARLGKAACAASSGNALDVMFSEPLEYRKTMKQIGKEPVRTFRAHYSGAPVSFISTVPTAIVQVTIEELLNGVLPGANIAAASGRAMMAGLASSVTTTPSELLKLHLRKEYDAGSERKFVEEMHNVCALAKRLQATDGSPRVLFRGITTKALREGIYAPGYMALYPWMSEQLQNIGLGDYSSSFCAAATTALIVTLATQPLDTISTRMQEDYSGETAQNSLQLMRELYRTQGWRGFYSGTSWRYLSIFISVCCMGNVIRWGKNAFSPEGEASRIIESE